MRVRTAKLADIPTMVRVINAAFTIETFLEGARTDRRQLEELMYKGLFLLAEKRGSDLIGCVYVKLRAAHGYFGMLAVDPSHQCRRVGSTLVHAAEDYCRTRGCEHMDLSVLSLRPELIPYYRNFGYHQRNTAEFRSTRPLKAGAECYLILMTKQLEPIEKTRSYQAQSPQRQEGH